MDFNLYDRIRLKDGRTASVVEIFGDGEDLLVDVDLEKYWETIWIKKDDIQELLGTIL